MIFDSNRDRRLKTTQQVIEKLRCTGWTIYVFTDDPEMYPSGYFTRRWIPITNGDAQEVVEAKSTHDKVAVVLDGMLERGGKPVDRLLEDTDVFVLAVTSVKCVQSDRRYTCISHKGGAWASRGPSKGFVDIKETDEPPESESAGLWKWISSWVMTSPTKG